MGEQKRTQKRGGREEDARARDRGRQANTSQGHGQGQPATAIDDNQWTAQREGDRVAVSVCELTTARAHSVERCIERRIETHPRCERRRR